MAAHGTTRWLAALLCAGLLLAPAGLRADQPDRPVPDYDGREEPPPTAGEVLLWVPRVVFYPVYLVTEYLVRWPLGTFVTWVEREHILDKAIGFFTFGTGGDVGIVPTAWLDFGFRPSIGIYMWADPAFTARDQLGFHFAWGGEDWWRVSLRETIGVGPEFADEEWPVEIELHFLLDYRPDHLFHGIGTQTGDPPTRFFWDQLGGAVTTIVHFSRVAGEAEEAGQDGFQVRLEARRNEFGGGDADDDVPDEPDDERPIEDVFDVADPNVVPGFDGYVLGSTQLRAWADTRAARPGPGDGVRFDAFGELATDLDAGDSPYVRYGGIASFFVDVAGRNRTLSLRQFVGLMEPLGDGPIPFAELFALGGVELMRGFLEGRYRGPSAFATTLQYTYPIWVFLDGYLFTEVGNVFGERLAGFDFEKMALSFGLGIRSNASREVAFDFLLGFGTDRFEAESFDIDTVTVQFGTTRGF